MPPKELTLRGLVLGALITTVFTAANVYLGLKVGLTFASSIPAAVISMAILSAVKDSSILENNIVQTVASAAGTLSAIIFVLPGLVIVGWWTGFPFWQSFLICVSGGVLGVLFTIPLRRALVTNSDLPYPEGVAAAEVLKVGSGTRGETKDETGEAREGLDRRDPRHASRRPGSRSSRRRASPPAEVTGFFRLGAIGVERLQRRLVARAARRRPSRRPVGRHGDARRAGHRVGDRGADPHVDAAGAATASTLAAHTSTIWRTQVRFIGAGAIAVAAIYTLATLAKPVVGGLVSTLARVAGRGHGRRHAIAISRRPGSSRSTVACLVDRRRGSRTRSRRRRCSRRTRVTLTLIAVPFVLLVGFLIAGVCGYMAGLIGASNSPISGVGILVDRHLRVDPGAGRAADAENRPALVAFALFVTAIVFACATISNDNLQDLKTGQLVGASPMRQQIALIVGVGAGRGGDPVRAQPAREGVRLRRRGERRRRRAESAAGAAGDADLGARAGRDRRQPRLEDDRHRRAGRRRADHARRVARRDGASCAFRRSPSASASICRCRRRSRWSSARCVATLVRRRVAQTSPNPERAERLGTLVASGLIVGESLLGVLNAGLIVGFEATRRWRSCRRTSAPRPLLGVLAFAALVVGLYSWLVGKARRPA